jgi:hypothetical protein
VTKFKISYAIRGMDDVISGSITQVNFNSVSFHKRENENVGTVIIDSKDSDPIIVEKDALYIIDQALGALCFAYSTESHVDPNSLYVKDLTSESNLERVKGAFTFRTSISKEDPSLTLNKIASLPKDRKQILDLAFKYYKISDIGNPLRIESFFSCIAVVIRNILGKEIDGYLSMDDLKFNLSSILRLKDPKFSQVGFEKSWTNSHSDERNNIAHGRPSRLTDITKLKEYGELANIVGNWARTVIYYYIDRDKNAD